MRRAALALVSTVAGLVGLLSFKTHPASAPANPPAAASTTGPGTASPGSAKTATGSAVDTQYGPVQVRITVTNGKISSAAAVEYPGNDPRSQQINAYAIPILEKESVGVSSASIDMVSGATYTSDGYLQSLQSALDKAGL